MIDLHNTRNVLVIVPHEDDEINLMGGFLPLLVEKRIFVKVCFTTNGDYEVPAEVRIREAINALKILGVEKEDVYFLGYPDASHRVAHSLYKTTVPVVSKHGSHTYGSDLKADYRMQKSGYHSEYIYKNLKKDLKDLIIDISPDIVFCIDMDEHHDHKLTSLVFEECMEEILAEDINYSPSIYKGFAYTTTYEGKKDFFKGLNLFPAANNRKNGDLANPCFQWDKRVRMPIAKECVARNLFNPLIKAILQHKSQAFGKRIANVINSDVVFWELPIKNRRIRQLIVEDILDFTSIRMISSKDCNNKNDTNATYLSVAKILLNDNFTYTNYYIENEKYINCDIYTYRYKDMLSIKLSDRLAELKNGKLYIPSSIKNIQLQLIDQDEKVIDEVCVKRLGRFARLIYTIKLQILKLRCYIAYKRNSRGE